MSSEKCAAQAALNLYVVQAKERLQKILQTFQWNEQKTRSTMQFPKALSSELELEPLEEQLPDNWANDTKYTVQLDAAKLEELLGSVEKSKLTAHSFEELQTHWTDAEKLLIYEHVMKSTPPPKQRFDDNVEFAEVVAVTGRVHKNRRRHRKIIPTLREEMHQLVQLQMDALERQYKDANKKTRIYEKKQKRQHERQRIRSGSRSRSSRKSEARQTYLSRGSRSHSSRKPKSRQRSLSPSHKTQRRLH
ncbi:uncharacterized protein LOC108605400 [Drosophila busckii]|uniref:uncharacterized protein LOC108605400 n=1 Tax=Drosophila busckii TaxID=30019 RepID=UPI00083EDA1A|nr:uncharacterized protein LOC108605400 [Drosophila busckii]